MDNRRKVPRNEVLEAIKSGRFQTFLPSGDEIIDFVALEKFFESNAKKVFTYWNNRERANGEMILSCLACNIGEADAQLLSEKQLDAVRSPWIGCEVAFTDKLAEQMKTTFVHAPRQKTATAKRAINKSPKDLKFQGKDREYSIRALEFIGDAIAEVVIRIIAFDICGWNRPKYGNLSCELRTNENFATYPGIRSGDQFEIIIGQEFALFGVEPAFAKADEMIRQTKVYIKATSKLEK